MPEASQKIFWSPGGPGGRVNGGQQGGQFSWNLHSWYFWWYFFKLELREMPEASQKKFWSPGGPGGTVFLKSAFLVFLVIFLQTWAEIDARSLPKFFLIPRGASFLVKNLEIEQFQLVSRKSKKLSLLYYFRTKNYVLGGLLVCSNSDFVSIKLLREGNRIWFICHLTPHPSQHY